MECSSLSSFLSHMPQPAASSHLPQLLRVLSFTGDHSRPPATTQPQTRDLPPQRNRQTLQDLAIHNKTAPQPTSGDHRRPQPPATTQPPRPSGKRARSTAIHNKTVPQPTSGDHGRPHPTTSATARPSTGGPANWRQGTWDRELGFFGTGGGAMCAERHKSP